MPEQCRFPGISRLTHIVESLYGDARLQPAQPSFLTNNEPYRRFRNWVTARSLEQETIVAIKAFHSAAFFVLASSVVIVAYACAFDRLTRHTRRAAVAVGVESIIILLNNGRCPLTSVVEDLGAEHGSVSDIFLPDRLARNIPHIASGLLGTGIVLLIMRRFLKRLT